jgi:hypothetical protein
LNSSTSLSKSLPAITAPIGAVNLSCNMVIPFLKHALR